MVDHSAVPYRGRNKRGMELLRGGLCIALALQLALSPFAVARTPEDKGTSQPSGAAWANDVVLQIMQTELSRATTGLAKSDPAPYFLSYTVYDKDVVILAG